MLVPRSEDAERLLDFVSADKGLDALSSRIVRDVSQQWLMD
jgi:hypothetical protein